MMHYLKFTSMALAVLACVSLLMPAMAKQAPQKEQDKKKEIVYDLKAVERKIIEKSLAIPDKLAETDGNFKPDLSKVGPKFADDDAIPGWVKDIADNGQPAKIYKVKFKKGEKFDIRANSDAGGNGFDAVLMVQDPKGLLLDADDDAGGMLNSLIRFVVPEDGVYSIIISHHPISDNKTGDFELKIKSREDD